MASPNCLTEIRSRRRGFGSSRPIRGALRLQAAPTWTGCWTEGLFSTAIGKRCATLRGVIVYGHLESQVILDCGGIAPHGGRNSAAHSPLLNPGAVPEALHGAKMASRYTLRHRLSKLTAGLQRMIEVEPRIHASPEDLVHPVARVFKHVLVDAIGECQAVRDNVDPGGAEEARNQRGRGACHATVSRRIFGMVGSRPLGDPGRVGGRAGVSAACLDRSDRPPEAVLVLCVETDRKSVVEG